MKNLLKYTKLGIGCMLLSMLIMGNFSCKEDGPDPVITETNLLCDGNGTAVDLPSGVGSEWVYEVIIDGLADTVPAKLTVFKDSVFNGKKYFGVESYATVWGIPHYYRVDSATQDLIYFNTSNYTEYVELPGNPKVGEKWNTYFSTREIISLAASVTTSSCKYTGLIEVLEKGNTIDRTFYFKKGLGIVRMVSVGGRYNKYEQNLKKVVLK